MLRTLDIVTIAGTVLPIRVREKHVLHGLCAGCGRMQFGGGRMCGEDGLSRYFPSGWSKIAKNWDGLCSYTAHHGGSRALCNVPRNTHAWKYARQAPKFMCGKIEGGPFKGTTHSCTRAYACARMGMRVSA